MKEVFLAADADPESAQAYISAKLANQAKLNPILRTCVQVAPQKSKAPSSG